MAWYVEFSGRQVWIESQDTAYTVCSLSEDLPFESLTYLAVNSQKAVYAEHSVEDEPDAKKKSKDKQSGRQRGFIVRVEHSDSGGVGRVTEIFRDAAAKLLASGVVNRIDIDETTAEKKRKKRGQKKAEEAAALAAALEEKPSEPCHVDLTTLAPNECRVVTCARCQHNAHGLGFRVEVAEGGSMQGLHIFTTRELPIDDWHEYIAEAIRSTGSRVLMSRIAASAAPDPPADGAARAGPRDKAQADADDWLASVMGRCLVSDNKTDTKATEAASGKADGDADGAGDAPEQKPAEQPKKQLPPWLRRRS
mmetsp:Transcript_54136/g.97198  ORF Transcript_54136/g.97198 Transcript_54136/m.97198 type:complete len:308 (-) Transcript_54136:53-976(-)